MTSQDKTYDSYVTSFDQNNTDEHEEDTQDEYDDDVDDNVDDQDEMEDEEEELLMKKTVLVPLKMTTLIPGINCARKSLMI